MIDRNYARVINGSLSYFPNPIKTDSGEYLCTNDPAVIITHGYKPVVRTPEPAPFDGYYWTSAWQETETECVLMWTSNPVPEPEPDPLAEVIDIMEGVAE